MNRYTWSIGTATGLLQAQNAARLTLTVWYLDERGEVQQASGANQDIFGVLEWAPKEIEEIRSKGLYIFHPDRTELIMPHRIIKFEWKKAN